METQMLLLNIFTYIIDAVLFGGGIFYFIKRPTHPLGYYLFFTLLLQVLNDVLYWYEIPNIYIFSVSYYLNFLYLSYYFFQYIFQIRKKIYLPILVIGSIPMFLKLILKDSIQNFEAYDWAFYDGWIVVLTLLALFKILQATKINKNHLWISFGILAFFGFDFSLALGMNYLINGDQSTVLWIWVIRAFVLLVYFFILNIFTWKILKV